MNAAVRSRRPRGDRDGRSFGRRSTIGMKLTALLVLVALLVIAFVTGLARGLVLATGALEAFVVDLPEIGYR